MKHATLDSCKKSQLKLSVMQYELSDEAKRHWTYYKFFAYI